MPSIFRWTDKLLTFCPSEKPGLFAAFRDVLFEEGNGAFVSRRLTLRITGTGCVLL